MEVHWKLFRVEGRQAGRHAGSAPTSCFDHGSESCFDHGSDSVDRHREVKTEFCPDVAGFCPGLSGILSTCDLGLSRLDQLERGEH